MQRKPVKTRLFLQKTRKTVSEKFGMQRKNTSRTAFRIPPESVSEISKNHSGFTPFPTATFRALQEIARLSKESQSGACLKTLFRREIPKFRAKNMKIEESYPEGNATKSECFAAEILESQQNMEFSDRLQRSRAPLEEERSRGSLECARGVTDRKRSDEMRSGSPPPFRASPPKSIIFKKPGINQLSRPATHASRIGLNRFEIIGCSSGETLLYWRHMSLSSFIKARPFLVWWTSDFDRLSDEAIVEATLNYGDWDDVQELFRLVGMEKAARIFRSRSSLARSNYRPKTKHFFTLYFNAHAPGDTR